MTPQRARGGLPVPPGFVIGAAEQRVLLEGVRNIRKPQDRKE
jgi:hypothetical protein